MPNFQASPDTFYIISPGTAYANIATLEVSGYYIESQLFGGSNRNAHYYPNMLPDLEKSKRPELSRFSEMMDRSVRGDGTYEFTWAIPFMPNSVLAGWFAILGTGRYVVGQWETISGDPSHWSSFTSIPWAAFNGTLQMPTRPRKDFFPERNGWRDVTWRFVDCALLGTAFH